MHIYDQILPQLPKMLSSMEHWLKAAADVAESKGFEADRYLGFRLAPDMFSLARNVQAACDSAKFAVARLSAKEAPSDPDTETTLDALIARIGKTREFIEGCKRGDFDGADTRPIELPFLPGKSATGAEYLTAFALPNFYFHATTTYAILRHNGVELGKRTFIGAMNLLPD